VKGRSTAILAVFSVACASIFVTYRARVHPTAVQRKMAQISTTAQGTPLSPPAAKAPSSRQKRAFEASEARANRESEVAPKAVEHKDSDPTDEDERIAALEKDLEESNLIERANSGELTPVEHESLRQSLHQIHSLKIERTRAALAETRAAFDAYSQTR